MIPRGVYSVMQFLSFMNTSTGRVDPYRRRSRGAGRRAGASEAGSVPHSPCSPSCRSRPVCSACARSTRCSVSRCGRARCRPTAERSGPDQRPQSYDGAMAIGYRHVGVIGAMAEEVERLHHHLVAEIRHRARRPSVPPRDRSPASGSPSSSRGSARSPPRSPRRRWSATTTSTRSCSPGIAGALHDDLAIGDVVVATELVQHDLAGPPEMFARGEIPLARRGRTPDRRVPDGGGGRRSATRSSPTGSMPS